MIVQILQVLCGLAALTIAADHLVQGASRLADGLRISPVVVGVVVVGIGTSTPELLVSGLAAARGDNGLAVGNLVGSNILNLTFLLGLAALVGPLTVRRVTMRREIPLTVIGVSLFAVATLIGLGLVVGCLLTVASLGALALLVRWSRSEPQDPTAGGEVSAQSPTGDDPAIDLDIDPVRDGSATKVRMLSAAGRTALGLLGVLAGAELLVTGACKVATQLGVSQSVIGFSLVAFGTSLPELVTTIQAQRRGQTDLVIGNLFGSNLFNSLGGGAIVGLARGFDTPAGSGVALLVAMVLATVLAWLLPRSALRLRAGHGLVLLVAYAATLPLLVT